MKRKMKRTAAIILAASMVLAIGAVGVSAAGHGRGRNHAGRKPEAVCAYRNDSCPNADADTEDICGNYGEGTTPNNCCEKFADKDDDGICDNCDRERLTPNSCERKFTDTNDDGVCDNYGFGHGKRVCGGRSK